MHAKNPEHLQLKATKQLKELKSLNFRIDY